ncbi:MAG TPA: hypothetical protein VIA62_01000 [Thermoanaerobaculia bacterium]|jgi:hypothetical protein|nr:hypothetical protein [Thermoanaerobaculia bacterium]
MLRLGQEDFTCGRSRYLDFLEGAAEPTAKIFVKVSLEDAESGFWAQIDTGSAWSVLDPLFARRLGYLDLDGEPIRLDTRLGRKSGALVRLPIRFLADDGVPFDTEGTFFICSDWPSGRTFLGYSGLLDAMRFALDPQANHFYFGP